MWLKVPTPPLYLVLLVASSNSLPMKEPLCRVECKGAKERAVCGTDGVTYSSRCKLQEALCSGFRVKFRHRGACHSEADGSRCLEEKRSALKTGDESGIPIFVPTCNEDGSYKQVQCHKGTGYCWCVTETGKPVPGSSVRNAKPLCHLLHVTGRFRRGKGKKGRKGEKGRRNVCTQADRTAFSSNLIDMVSTEHANMFGARGRPNGTILGNAKKEVAEWKFAQLDEDRDGILKKKELKVFRGEIKKVLRPRRCGRSFTRYCDQDSNRKISRQEWKSCIGIEENISFSLFAKLRSEEDEEKREKERRRKEDADRSHGKSFPGQQQRDQASPPSLYARQYEEKREHSNDDAVRMNVECEKARIDAAREAMAVSEGLFIPECDRMGKYLPVQCYKSEGYCWCVDPDSGRPIPGTSTRNTRPSCSINSQKKIKTKPKEWKKCEGSKRDVFLGKLFEWMTLNVGNSTVPYMIDSEPDLTLNQRVAKWQFIALDRSRNGYLEKREVKRWKKAMRPVPGLTLCGKRINQHCDTDKDTRISQTEWTICLGVAKEEEDEGFSPTPLRPVGKRRGPNPLKTWLKAD